MKKLALALALTASFAQAQVFDVPAPKKSWFGSSDATKTLYRATPNSQGVIIFIPGGFGQVSLDSNRDYPASWWAHLQDYAYQSSRVPMDLVMMDSPYPVQPNARWGGDHIDRIRSVVEEYRQRTGKPVWLYGHSLGATAVSAFLKDPENERLIAGAIFSAGQTPSISRTVNVPMLIIHNDQDACSYTPVSTSVSFYEDAKKRNQNKTELKIVSGGYNYGNACTSVQSTHAYYGIHNQVTNAIDAFIK